MVTNTLPWHIDPQDPRAPSQEVWDRLSPEERERVVNALPSEFPASEVSPPAGDLHLFVQTRALDSLREYFERERRRIYVAGDIPVYYPDEHMFAADLVAVLDVDPHFRNSWVVSREGKGLDFALEIHVAGNLHKDATANVARYARLGIREYFIFDAVRERLAGHRLPEPGAAYRPIVPQRGYWESQVLQLDLSVKDGRVRFSRAGALVPELKELIETLGETLNRSLAKHEEAERALAEAERAREEAEWGREEEAKARAAAEQAREDAEWAREEAERVREAEARARAEAERELARLKEELERLRKG